MMTRTKQEKRGAFTLIEMMVVVAIIGILIAGVFRLLGAAGESNKKALTVARMQKLQNALSGFYAEYGTYPPVSLWTDPLAPDPYAEFKNGSFNKVPSLLAENAKRAAACQSIAFEYPNRKSLNDYVNTRFSGDGVVNVNDALGGQNLTKAEWKDVQVFKFGLLSYLLPRVELMGGEDLVDGTGDTPAVNFFSSRQWKKNNAATIQAQRTQEGRAVARWLPNFEKSLYGGYTIFGIDTAEPDHGGPHFVGAGIYPFSGGGNKYVLVCVTIHDGWGNDFYYYSAPPYQSYRIWSAGSNGNTFPPWITLESLSTSDRKTVSNWVEDDIVRFDR